MRTASVIQEKQRLGRFYRMRIGRDNLGIMSLFFVMLACGLPSSASESSTLPQNADQQMTHALLLQLGSQVHDTMLDCSHLVHSLYKSAGMDYPYATSHALYRGTEEFHRVLQPSSGDLVVWRGHMGIVVDPSQHLFMSALKTHVKTSSYLSQYWKHRGPLRFFQYIKGCKVHGSALSDSCPP